MRPCRFFFAGPAGADVMKRIAAPMIGGLVTSFILELLVYPAIYKLWKARSLGSDTAEPTEHGMQNDDPALRS